FTRSDHTGTVRTNQHSIRVTLEKRFHLHHVEDGDAFGDGDDCFDAGVGGFHDGVGAAGGGDEAHGCCRAGFFDGFGDGVEDGQAVGVFGGAFAGGGAVGVFV